MALWARYCAAPPAVPHPLKNFQHVIRMSALGLQSSCGDGFTLAQISHEPADLPLRGQDRRVHG